jgi:hypothetical protein
MNGIERCYWKALDKGNVQRTIMTSTPLFISLMLLVSCLVMGLGCGSRSDSQASIVKAAERLEDNPRLGKLLANLEERHRGGFHSFIHRNAEGKIDQVALYGKDAVDENIELISTLPNLECLCLGCCADNPSLSSKAFDLLKMAKKLKVLKLYGAVMVLNKEMCRSIAALKQLEVFDLQYGQCDPEGVVLLKKMTNLKKLDLHLEQQESP